jgi:hemerythrin-like domain-containing protein
MPDTLSLWHADHVNFAKLLDLLDEQLRLFHDGGSPDYELMLDIMFYMTHYPDALHHPKEDLVFARIKEREASAAPKIDGLLLQHASLKACGEQLVHDLDDILNGSIIARERVEATARAYLQTFRDHMEIEETEILPLVTKLLRRNDWTTIDAAVRHIEDPIFGVRTEERYAALAQQLAARSGRTAATTR